jgi:ribosomal protein S18 acetylase RimI-like enzyme
MATVEIRPARLEDKAPVLAFSRRSFEWGDYIEHVWDDWISDPTGELVVAAQGDIPVGVAFVTLLTETEAWYQGVRVAPEMRGQGIGTALTTHCAHRARDLGAEIVRACVESTNVASQTMMQRAGYAQIGSFVKFEAETAEVTPDQRVGPLISQPGPDRLEGIWSWLEHSNLVSLNGGLLLTGWRGVALTDERLNYALIDRDVWLLEEWGNIQALAIAAPRQANDQRTIFSTQYIDGTAEGVGRLMLYLRAHAMEQGFAIIDVRSPDLLILFDALNGAGFERRDEHGYWIMALAFGGE